MFQKVYIVLLVLLLLMPSFGCEQSDSSADGDQENQAKDKQIPVKVKTLVSERLNIIVEASGVIESDLDVTVLSETNGRIININFALGDVVKKGAVLVSVDSEAYKIALNIAKAAFAEVSILKEQSEAEYNRAKKLHESKNISEQLYEQAMFAFKRASASLKSAKWNVENAKRNLRLTKVKAPFAGEIAVKLVKLGNVLRAGTPVAQLIDGRDLKIKIGVGEDSIDQITKGQQATVFVPTLNKQNFKAKVQAIGSKALSPTMTYPVELVFDEIPKSLKAGMVARVKISVDAGREVLMIPLEVPVDRFDRYFVFVVNDNAVIEKRVELGEKTGQKVELKSGVNPGDVIVVTGQNNLKDGSYIKVVE